MKTDLFSHEQLEEQREYLRKMIKKIAFKLPNLTIPEYAERYINVNTGPSQGKFSLKTFPPIEEILYNMSPQSKINNVYIMCSIQTLKTMVLDLCAMYGIDHDPQDILFVSSTERLGVKWRTRRLEPMLNTSGVRERRVIGEFSENKKSRRSGETTFSLSYEGRTLDIGTAGSASSLSADSKKILLADEIARWPDDVGGEGDPFLVAAGRTTAFGNMAKICAVSSPLLQGDCKMESLYLSGDQRIYFATCPYCGKRQPLIMGSPESKSGLKWETKAGRPDYSTIRYVCDFCSEGIPEFFKSGMLQKEQPKPIKYPERKPEIPGWEPTATPDEPWIVSYNINAIYSPFFDWRKMISEYRKAVKRPELMQTFTNQRLGLPFKMQGVKPEIESVIDLRGDYKSGQIPHEVLFLTAFVDVQHGEQNWQIDDSKKPARLEMDITGHGDGYRSFGILYRAFKGELNDIYSGAWAEFREFIEDGGLTFESRGQKYSVELCFIDAGSSLFNDQIYQFCREMGVTRFSPSMGFNTLKRKQASITGKDDSDSIGARQYDRYRREQEGDVIIYKISTYFFKLALFTRLNTSIQWKKEKPGERTPAGFCGFPEDFTPEYFEMLLSEEHLPDKMKFIQPNPSKPNEALDCKVGNLAAAEVFLYQRVIALRAKFKAMQAPDAFIAGISAKFIITLMKKQRLKGRELSTAEIKNQLRIGKLQSEKETSP